MPKVIQVVESTITRGSGVITNPIRTVTQFHDFEGNFLGENDPAICATCRNFDGRIVSNCLSDHK